MPTPSTVEAPAPDVRLTQIDPPPTVPASVVNTQQAGQVIQSIANWGELEQVKLAAWNTWYDCVYLPFVRKFKPAAGCPQEKPATAKTAPPAKAPATPAATGQPAPLATKPVS